MLNRYYAEIIDIDNDNNITRYGYAFRAKSMWDARVHAIQTARHCGYVPCPSVWRVNKSQYEWMGVKYAAPTLISWEEEHPLEAA